MTTYYRNEYLFSEIYLQEITQQPEDTEILASLTTLKEYREFARTASIQEWKESFVHEVLYALRFGVKSENEGLTLLYPMGNMETPLTLCYVLLPTEDLDNTTMGRNWAEKVIRSLRHHNLKWGLLTNGEQWRMYHLDESTPYEIFLEINLADILSDSASQAYQIFHKFMKVENFTTGEQGQCRLDVFKKESLAKIDYIESELANALKQKEEGGKGVLSNLCMGYVGFLKASGSPNFDDEALRIKIYHGAMLYMFRLLFLFYADARGLLNETNSKLLNDVLRRSKLSSANNIAASSYSIWEDLERIFVDIDHSYNGGLFDPHESVFTIFIEESRVNDAYLASALHYLTSYQERSGEEKAISYRDMSVRHLGTLYEGLLEHKLFIAKEDTEVRATKDKIQFISASQGGKVVSGRYIPAGQVYFGSDRSERKATGSFYTPEYIVDYIVRNTVGEMLSQLRKDFLAEQKDLLSALTKAINRKERKAITELLEDNLKTLIKAKILKLSVLDPAMGSGHFLVNTSNFIANFITEILNEFEIIGTTETSTTYWRRWVVENCVYGVDVNPLAVELAKLSLWILSMSKEKPLSFLNHNLKTGNSLIGARLDDIGKYPGKGDKKQPSIFSDGRDFKEAVGKAISNYTRITSTDSASLDVIAEKKAWLDEIDEILKPYKQICDIHTSIYFDDEISEWHYKEIINNRGQSITDSISKSIQSYFHWEIEFPQIFIELKGFDCAIGNPPYIEVKKIDDSIKPYLRNSFCSDNGEELIKGRYDIYWAFIILTVWLLKPQGYSSLLTSNSYGDSESAKNLRQYLLKNCQVRKISDFGKFSKDVGVNVWMTLIQNCKSNEYTIIIEDLKYKEPIKYEVKSDALLRSDKTIIQINNSSASIDFLKDFTKKSNFLSNIIYLQQGMIIQSSIGKRDNYISQEKIDESYKPYIEAKDISTNSIQWKNRYLKYRPLEHHRPRIKEVFIREKILVKRIASEIMSVVDREMYFTDNTILTGTLYHQLDDIKNRYTRQLKYTQTMSDISKMYDYYSLSSIMNSRFMNKYNTLMNGTITLEGLNSLPIPHLTNLHASILSKLSLIQHVINMIVIDRLGSTLRETILDIIEYIIMDSFTAQDDLKKNLLKLDDMIPKITITFGRKCNESDLSDILGEFDYLEDDRFEISEIMVSIKETMHSNDMYKMVLGLIDL